MTNSCLLEAYSITSSARARSVGGTATLRVFAVVKWWRELDRLLHRQGWQATGRLRSESTNGSAMVFLAEPAIPHRKIAATAWSKW